LYVRAVRSAQTPAEPDQLAEATCILHWGRFSDSVGRKPAILLGCAGQVIAVVTFGFARSLAGMVASRLLLGSLCGNVAILKAVITEIVPERRRGEAFLIMPVGYSLGGVIGPM
jgi:MFS family permease